MICWRFKIRYFKKNKILNNKFNFWKQYNRNKMEENTITTNEPVVEQAAATVVTAEEVKVDEVGGADEPMNAAAAPKNLINLTVKTPKEKETVSISAEANVKEVFFLILHFVSNFNSIN